MNAQPQVPRDLFSGINGASDPANLTDLEKKHLPVIAAPAEVSEGQRFDVCVEVGKLLEHPNEKQHFIEFVELHAGELPLVRLDLSAENTWPVLKARVSLPKGLGPLRAYARCNLHGLWKAEHPLTVK
jgi:superoxide reductase